MINKDLISKLKRIIYEAADIALEYRKNGFTLDYKVDNSIVTSADIAVSNYICDALTELNPDIKQICEERSLSDVSNEKYFWLIDPIDGTNSYAKGKDSFTINIALIKESRPILGFICAPAMRELYYTDENIQLQYEQNHQKIAIKKPVEDGKLVAVLHSRYAGKAINNYLKLSKFTNIHDVASSLKLCRIASFQADAYPKFTNIMQWDIAAGEALINSTKGRIIALPDLNFSESSEMAYKYLCANTNSQVKYGKNSFKAPQFIACSERYIKQLLLAKSVEIE